MRVARGVLCLVWACFVLGFGSTPARAQAHCVATFSLDDAVTLGALQIEVDYPTATTQFDGTGTQVNCTGLIPALATFQDDDAGTLTMAYVGLGAGFSGPGDLASCDLTGDAPQASDLQLTVTASTNTNSDPVPAPAVSVWLFCDGDTTTTVSTSTSTTLPPNNEVCTVQVDIEDAVTLGSLQVEIDYRRAHGDFQDTGAAVDCVSLVSGALASFFDDDVDTLNAAFVSLSGIVGPRPAFRCIFLPSRHTPDINDFDLTIHDASDPNSVVIVPTPSVIVSAVDCVVPQTTTTTTTSTTLPSCGNSQIDAGEECDDGNGNGGDGCDALCLIEGICGDADLNTRITAGDAQLILQAAVGLPAACPLGVCDTNSDGGLTVGDAQRTLVSAVGLPAVLQCT